MQEQKYIYRGNSDIVTDQLADRINALPYDVVFTQFEGNEEAFFAFSMESYYEEYNAMVISMIALQIREFSVEANVVSKVSSYSYGTVDEMALAKQVSTLDDMMLECGFQAHHEHQEEHDCDCDHDHQHDHDCDCDCHHLH